MADKTAIQQLNDLITELEVSVAANNKAISTNATIAKSSETVKDSSNKKEKKEKNNSTNTDKKAAKNAPAAAVDHPITVNSIDLRVGIITTVRKHETAEKLYCEEIDVGEDVPRAIASGLVPYYTLEQMQGRKLIVVCNLKPRNLVGFKSHGMVLCAAKKDHDGNDVIEFVDPPANSNPGDRIVGENLELFDALSPSQCDKKKAFEIVANELKVDSEGIATWNGHRLVTIAGEVCRTPTITDAMIR